MLLRMRQRVVSDERRDMGEFGRLRPQKFLARGSMEEEVANGDGSPQRQPSLFHADDLATVDFEDRPRRLFFRARFQMQPRDRGDGRQRLAAKSERGNA